MLRQPIAALRQRLRLAVDRLHAVSRADAQQAMMNSQRQLAADAHVRPREAIERVRDAAVGRVFHRHDAELGLPALDLFEHGRNRADRHQLGPLAEPLDRRQMAEREFGPEIRDAQSRLHGPRAADQFAKDRPHRLIAAAARVVRLDRLLQHLRLALRIVDRTGIRSALSLPIC